MTAPLTPSWLLPAAQGLLSTKRGANTGADAINLSVQYQDPQSSDGPGTIRVGALRTALAGAAQAEETAWEPVWVGTQSTVPAPVVFSGTGAGRMEPTQAVTYNGRVYAVDGQILVGVHYLAPVYSAALTGGSVTWRRERAITADFPISGGAAITTTSLAVVNGILYAADQVYVFWAPIMGDGSLGAWSRAPVPAGGGTTGAIMAGGSSATAAFVWYIVPTITPGIWYATLNADGSPGAWRVLSGGLPAAVLASSGVYYDAIAGKLYLIGGTGGSAIYIGTVTGSGTTAGDVTAWATGATGLPAIRSLFGFCVVGATPTDAGTMFIFGGADNGGASTSTIWTHLASTLGTGAWTVDAVALPATMRGLVAGVSPDAGYTAADGVAPYVVVFGNNATTVYSDHLTASGATWIMGAAGWKNGAAGGLSAGDLGTGGSVTANLDGTWTVAFRYGAFGPATPLGLGDGDQVQLTVQFTDVTTGAPSPVSPSMLLKIGQPPTVSGLTFTGNSGKPPFSFAFNPGAGGSAEAYWRVVVTDKNALVVYDTGQKNDQSNSTVVNPPNGPLLSNPLAPYTASVTAAAGDSPMPGSSASAGPTTATYTPTGTAPNAPTGLTAVTDNANGLVTVAWTNPGAGGVPATARVYRRVNGASAWQLLKDGVAAAGLSNPFSLQLMDDVKLGVGYDYTVAVLTASPLEGPQVAAVSNVAIGHPDRASAGAYTAMLHIVGAGPTAGIHVGLLYNQPGRVNRKVDAPATPAFGATAPTIRYGSFNYRELEVRAMLLTDAARDTLEAILAQAAAGSTLCYRDTHGLLIYCGLGPERPRYAHRFNEETIRLVETAFVYAP